MALLAGRKVELDDAMAVGRIGEFETENCRVIFGLLQTVAWKLVGCLGFDHRQHEVSGIAQQIVGTFGRSTAGLGSNRDNASICKTFLLADLIVVPARGVELWQDVLSTGVGFSDHAAIGCRPGKVKAR